MPNATAETGAVEQGMQQTSFRRHRTRQTCRSCPAPVTPARARSQLTPVFGGLDVGDASGSNRSDYLIPAIALARALRGDDLESALRLVLAFHRLTRLLGRWICHIATVPYDT